LAELAGKPLVGHVVERAREAASLTRLIVATDDPRIVKVVEGEGAEGLMTPPDLPSGSDRVAWVVRELGQSGDRYDAVVNIQGDEPFLPGAAIDRAVELLQGDPEASIATAAVGVDRADASDPNVVKVVMDRRGRALYFSRAVIPHGGGDAGDPLYRHVGLYVFRPDYLERFVTMGPGVLEQKEDLEQLRALEDGAIIAVAVGDWPVLAVDTPEDLIRAEERLSGTATQ
jgi:3-deoxy-manno-octulosonate cytidylyltransferase (CMP-KDO synthetase)